MAKRISEIVKSMMDDIRYCENLGMDGGEIYESMSLDNYSPKATDADKDEAFKRCGYTITYKEI